MTNKVSITKDKILVHVESDLYDGWIPTNTVERIKAFAEPGCVAYDDTVKEGIEKWKADKIPAELIKKVLGTLSRYEHMETGYVLYRDPIRRKWDIRCPAQKGTSVHVNFFEEEHPDISYQVIGTIHIHPQMGAFWSGTDLADQTKKPGSIHMVFGTSGKFVTQTLCTVFESGAYYNVPFETVCEAVDFSEQNQPDEEWCRIIDKQDWVDPTKPALPKTPYIASQYSSPVYTGSISYAKPVRKTYDKFDSAYFSRYEDNLYDYYDYPLARYESSRNPTSYQAKEPYSWDNEILRSIASVVACAADKYGTAKVLEALSDKLGVTVAEERTTTQPASEVQQDTCTDEPVTHSYYKTLTEETDDLLDRMATAVIEGEEDHIGAVRAMLDFARLYYREELMDAADEAAFDDDEEDAQGYLDKR